MRVFISYAHVDWQFVKSLSERLRRHHDVWFDEGLHAGQDWWQAILHRLDWCECFIYVLSPESLDSTYCCDEYDEAKRLRKHIIPIRLQPNIELPDDLAAIQYADFATRVFEDAMIDLVGDLGALDRRSRPPQRKVQPTPSVPPPDAGIDDVVTFRGAVDARSAGDHETALRLLNTLRRNAPNFLPDQVGALIQDSRDQLEMQSRRKEYDRLYQQVSLLTLDPLTSEDAQQMWKALRADYPNIADDPDNLEERLRKKDSGREAPDIPTILPGPFEWCEIPAVAEFPLETDKGNKGVFTIDPFYMAKYPITYAQFQVFIDAEDGFHNAKWWEGLATDAGHKQQPGNQRFKVDNHPRENVSWYDAVAFCRWLSDKLGYEMRLPTEWEWQWAAQGPDGREYPWGDGFDKAKCNTRESDIGQTTPVDQYPSGAGPFGVMDMAGNVWEWCLNEYSNPENTGLAGNAARVLRGGSWYSSQSSARCAYRVIGYPNSRGSYNGFRVCASPFSK